MGGLVLAQDVVNLVWFSHWGRQKSLSRELGCKMRPSTEGMAVPPQKRISTRRGNLQGDRKEGQKIRGWQLELSSGLDESAPQLLKASSVFQVDRQPDSPCFLTVTVSIQDC